MCSHVHAGFSLASFYTENGFDPSLEHGLEEEMKINRGDKSSTLIFKKDGRWGCQISIRNSYFLKFNEA